MDKAESSLLQQLLLENNQLKSQLHTARRENYNITLRIENLEEELVEVKSQSPYTTATKVALHAAQRKASVSAGEGPHPPLFSGSAGGGSEAAEQSSLMQDLQAALFINEKQNEEIHQLQANASQMQLSFEATSHQLQEVMTSYRHLQEESQESRHALRLLEDRYQRELARMVTDTNHDPAAWAHQQQALAASQALIQNLEVQITTISNTQNETIHKLQAELQGTEALVSQMQKEYEEFMDLAHVDHEAARQQLLQENQRIRDEFEQIKTLYVDTVKRNSIEHGSLLQAMQAQFDEYRLTAEYLYNVEMERMEGELIRQTQRFQQEMVCMVQAKDKFCSDLLVVKDAKIMALIDGSDLRAVLQKHEWEFEMMRKEHQQEIERIKHEQEGEQQALIQLLQRQNQSLESKAEKLQAHIRSAEQRNRELAAIIEKKTALMTERDEQRALLENSHAQAVEQLNQQIAALRHEKQHLRHKVIRLSMYAKGQGSNTIDSMLKRVTRETAALEGQMESMTQKHEAHFAELSRVQRQLRDREGMIRILESEIDRRSTEFVNLTRTFETFLASKQRAQRQAQASRLTRLAAMAPSASPTASPTSPALELVGIGSDHAAARRDPAGPAPAAAKGHVVKAHVPTADAGSVFHKTNFASATETEPATREMAELRRFKALSHAFAAQPNFQQRLDAMLANPLMLPSGKLMQAPGQDAAGAAGKDRLDGGPRPLDGSDDVDAPAVYGAAPEKGGPALPRLTKPMLYAPSADDPTQAASASATAPALEGKAATPLYRPKPVSAVPPPVAEKKAFLLINNRGVA